METQMIKQMERRILHPQIMAMIHEDKTAQHEMVENIILGILFAMCVYDYMFFGQREKMIDEIWLVYKLIIITFVIYVIIRALMLHSNAKDECIYDASEVVAMHRNKRILFIRLKNKSCFYVRFKTEEKAIDAMNLYKTT